jgi:tRNA-Thr(GGU) m(6)t(6)A37 methyltransferase TsaA
VPSDTERPSAITFEPIGILHSPFVERADAPRQATVAREVEGRVSLFAGRGLEDAVSDLELWDYVWLIVCFHKNEGFRPKVLPPRSDKKRGVLATRSPYRPNPIGLSAVKLVAVEGLDVRVRGLDLLDGTPVLDIKPYVPYADALPHAGHGWLEPPVPGQTESPPGQAFDPLPAYEVTAESLAQAQLDYLASEHGIALWPRIQSALALGPAPHAYRRIKKEGEGYVLAVKDWRVRFSVAARKVSVQQLFSGYKPRELWSPSGAPDVHRAFTQRFSARP